MKFTGWHLGDPTPGKELMVFYVPRESGVGHPGILILEGVTQDEMERMDLFLATEST